MEKLVNEEESARQRFPLSEESNSEVESNGEVSSEVESNGEVSSSEESDKNEKGETSRQRLPLEVENRIKSKWLEKVATFASKLLIEFVAHAFVFWAFQWLHQISSLS